jgi:hypothetical protein
VVPRSFTGVDSFDKARFRFIAGHPSLSLQETELSGGRDYLLPCDLIAERYAGSMVWSTVIPRSFTGIDSFDKIRFRFIAGHLPILVLKTETGGKG